MKKLSSILLVFISFLLIGCAKTEVMPQTTTKRAVTTVSPSDNTQVVTVSPDADVTIYLVLTEVGLYNGAKGQDYAELGIENAIEFKGKVGDALPDGTKITASGSKGQFSSWVSYDGKGAPTAYTTIPNVDGKILYANWSEGDSENPITPVEKECFYLKPNANWLKDGARFAVYTFNGSETGVWFDMTDSDGDGIYEISSENLKEKIIFCRMNGSKAENNWDNRWNQTNDLTLPTDGSNLYTVAEGAWSQGDGSWSTK